MGNRERESYILESLYRLECIFELVVHAAFGLKQGFYSVPRVNGGSL